MKPKKVQQTNLKNQKGFFPKMLPRRSPDATYENVHAFNMYISYAPVFFAKLRK